MKLLFLVLSVTLWFSNGQVIHSDHASTFFFHAGHKGKLGSGGIPYEAFLMPTGVKLIGAEVDDKCVYGICSHAEEYDITN